MALKWGRVAGKGLNLPFSSLPSLLALIFYVAFFAEAQKKRKGAGEEKKTGGSLLFIYSSYLAIIGPNREE